MFSDGLNQGTIDVVDDNDKKQNNQNFGHGCAVRLPSSVHTRHIIGIR